MMNLSIHPFDRLPFTENYPQPVSLREFNRELVTLFGKHLPTGQPHIRAVWMPSQQRDGQGRWLAKDWSPYGRGGHGEWRQRYLYASSQSYQEAYDEARQIWGVWEVWNDIAPQRFCVEKLILPEFALPGWDRHTTSWVDAAHMFRVGRDGDGDAFTARKPVEGYYVPMEGVQHRLLKGGVIATHDDCCCAQAKREQVMCYGSYAEPGEAHLSLFRKAACGMRYAEKAMKLGPLSAAEREQKRKQSAERLEQWEAGVEARLTQRINEARKTHRGMLSSDPTVQANGVYHWLSGHNKSGTPKKEEKAT